MQLLFSFLFKKSIFLFFVFLELIAFVLIIRNNKYHESVMGSSATSVTGYVNGKNAELDRFWHLDKDNAKLMAENKNLREALTNANINPKTIKYQRLEEGTYRQKYLYTPAAIINNSIVMQKNYITLNKGIKDGIREGMGIITDRGIVGIVTTPSNRYAGAISLLNTNARINARIKRNLFFGTLLWKGESTQITHLTEIPKYVDVKVGDTIETDGKSTIFPEGIMIGTVKSFTTNQETGDHDIKVKLMEDFGNVRNVYVVQNLDKMDIEKAEQAKDQDTNAQ